MEDFPVRRLTLTWKQVQTALIDQAGTSGHDTIISFTGNDMIRGRAGNDTLIGVAGDDSYTYVLGDGNDVIRDGGFASADRFILDGISLDSI